MSKVINFQPSSKNQLSAELYQMGLEGLYYLPNSAHPDQRGFYAELAKIPDLEKITGQEFKVKQVNLSYSKQNVIRGFHTENWNKLLTIITGKCFAAWVDLRPDSDAFGQVVTATFGVDDQALGGSVFVAAGIANSFCVIEGPLNYLYSVDQLYRDRDKSGDVAISLFDPDLNVNWPIAKEKMIISDRDQQAVTLRERFSEKF